MRIRSTSRDTDVASFNHTMRSYAGTCVNPQAFTETVYSGSCKTVVSEVMEDVVTPDFYRRIANGEIINNPMSKVTTIVTNPSVQRTYGFVSWRGECTPTKQLWIGGTGSGTIPASTYFSGSQFLTPPSLDIERVTGLAVTNCHASASQAKTLVLASLGELDETVTSLSKIFRRVYRMCKAVRRFDLKYLRKQITRGELADRYMEWRYAVRPLAYDVLSTLEAINAEKGTDRQTFRGYASDSAVATSYGYTVFEDDNYKLLGNKITSRQVTARAGLLARVECFSGLHTWGLSMVPESVWELIPASFIVDWFFNVGKTVAAWTPNGGLRTLASWVVVEDTIIQTLSPGSCTVKRPTTNVVYKYFTLSGGRSKTTITKTRTPNPALPIMPTYMVRLDAAKLLDLALILRKMFFR